jgi:CubicO group peptidase (beta-lactamase class C family)
MRNVNFTLANWQEPEVNQWGFSHVRELIPTERIGRGEGPAVPFERGEQLDLDRISFDALGRAFSIREALDATHTDAVVVLHEGRIVFEEYGPEMSRSQTHILMSVSKSVTSTLTGILVSEGLLRTSDLVTDHIAAFVGTSLEGCTVQNLLDMRGGVRFSEDYADLHADVRIYEQVAGHRPRTDVGPHENLYDYMPTLAPRGEHGGTFEYQSILTDILGWVLESCGGMTFAELVSDRIWSKMGAQYDAEVTVDVGGCALADGGVCTTVLDLARFGLLYLRGGRANGVQVVPAQWVSACTTSDADLVNAFPATISEGTNRFAMYHNCWWVVDSEGPVSAGLGIYGQFLHLDAVNDTVVAKFSSWPHALETELGDLHFELANALGKAVHHAR